jgi:multidrug efflux pump subunit AcrA (membrane-fusion protein)
VEAISPDAITPRQNSTNEASSHPNTSPKATAPNAFYEVTIKPETLVLGKGKNPCHIQLGMEGRVDIISREETVLQFFLRKARLIADV